MVNASHWRPLRSFNRIDLRNYQLTLLHDKVEAKRNRHEKGTKTKDSQCGKQERGS